MLLPRSLDQVMRLRDKLVNIVVVAIINGVDIARPTAPACPLAITYPLSANDATLTSSAYRP